MRKVMKDEVKTFIKENYLLKSDLQLLYLIEEKFGETLTVTAIKSYRIRNNLKKTNKCKALMDMDEKIVIDYLKKHVEGKSNLELMRMVNKEFNLNFTFEQFKDFKSRRGLTSGKRGWHRVGNPPGNKGHKMTEYTTEEKLENSRKTQFKKGEKPHNYVPVGTISRNSYNQLRIKVDDTTWETYSRYIWEKEVGEIPEGMKIAYKDGNGENCSIDNLMLVSQSELMSLNHRGFRSSCAELTEAGLAAVRLENRVKELKKGDK